MKKTDFKILILEDDLILAEALKENLEDLGYDHIKVCSNFLEVENTVVHTSFDIIISDISLKKSNLNGIEIVKTLNLSKNSMVIFLSSYSNDDFRSKAVEAGANAYLTKPVSIKQLETAIDFGMKQKYSQTVDIVKPICPLYRSNEYVFVKTRLSFTKVRISEIVYLKADRQYSYVYTVNRKLHINTHLQSFIDQVDVNNLIRCHRSYIVNIDYIESIADDQLNMGYGNMVENIPIGENFKYTLMDNLVKIK